MSIIKFLFRLGVVLALAWVLALSPAFAAEPVTIVGRVEQVADGFVIKAEDKVYFIPSDELADMVGKTVKVTGQAELDDQGRLAIDLDNYEEVRP